MAFRYSYSDQEIASTARVISSIYRDVTNPRIDGFTQWSSKQDLYRLKWLIEDLMRKCPEFSLEPEWVREQEKKKVIDILKSENDI